MDPRIALLVGMLAFGSAVAAIERKPLEQVNVDALTQDTQSMAQGAGHDHMALAWWIPNEFWNAVLSQDPATQPADRAQLMHAMSGVSILAVVQADISTFGAFAFRSLDQVRSNMVVTFTDPRGQQSRLQPLQQINPDLELVLNIFKPILSAAMGNLGSNLHFFVLDDQAGRSRRLDPYAPGVINVTLRRDAQRTAAADIELPLNALFVPRRCPNGREAHVSWRYCPWSGTPLPE